MVWREPEDGSRGGVRGRNGRIAAGGYVSDTHALTPFKVLKFKEGNRHDTLTIRKKAASGGLTARAGKMPAERDRLEVGGSGMNGKWWVQRQERGG